MPPGDYRVGTTATVARGAFGPDLDGPLRQWPVIVATCGERSRYLVALRPTFSSSITTSIATEAFKNFLESAGHRLCIEPRGEEKAGVSIIGSAPQLRLS